MKGAPETVDETVAPPRVRETWREALFNRLLAPAEIVYQSQGNYYSS